MPQFTYCTPGTVQGLFGNALCNTSADQINFAILMASAWVENVTQRCLGETTYTEEAPLLINRWNVLVGKVRQWPILSVSSLQLLVDGLDPSMPISLDVSWVDVNRPPKRLFYYTGPLSLPQPVLSANWQNSYAYISRGQPGVIQFTYQAGYDPIPNDIVLGTAFYTMYLLSLTANPMGAASLSVSTAGGSTGLGLPPSGGFYLERATELVSKYTKVDSGAGE